MESSSIKKALPSSPTSTCNQGDEGDCTADAACVVGGAAVVGGAWAAGEAATTVWVLTRAARGGCSVNISGTVGAVAHGADGVMLSGHA